MFAPARSQEDWPVLEALRQWSISERVAADLERFLRNWSKLVYHKELDIELEQLNLATSYAGLDREHNRIVVDGSIRLRIDGAHEAVELPTVMRFRFPDQDSQTPALFHVNIVPPPAALSPRPRDVA